MSCADSWFILYYTLLLINQYDCFFSYVRKRNWRRWRKGWDNGQNNGCRTKDLRCLTFQCVQTAVCIGLSQHYGVVMGDELYSLLKQKFSYLEIQSSWTILGNGKMYFVFLAHCWKLVQFPCTEKLLYFVNSTGTWYFASLVLKREVVFYLLTTNLVR